MSERDWSLATAVGVVAVTCFGFGIGLWAGGNHHTNESHSQSAPSAYEAQPDLSLLSEETKGAGSYETICQRPVNHDYADLCQQWHSAQSAADSAGYAKGQFWVSIFGLIGLIATVILSGLATRAALTATREGTRATEAATRSADAAEKAYLAENRPWLDVSIGDVGEVNLTGSEITLTFTVTAKNIGNRPAIAKLFGRVARSGPFWLAGKGSIDWAINHFPVLLGIETLMFPERETSMTYQRIAAEWEPTMLASDRELRALNPNTVLPDDVNLSVPFGVLYRAVGSEKWYQTAYVASLHKKGGGSFKMGEVVASDDVVVAVGPTSAKVT